MIERWTLPAAVGTLRAWYDWRETSLTQRFDRLRRDVTETKFSEVWKYFQDGNPGEKILSACTKRAHICTARVSPSLTLCCVCDWHWFVRLQVLTGSLLLRVAGRVVAVGVQRLRPLLAGRVAGLVGVPGLFAVVAKLRAAAFSATNQPGTAGTARGDDGEPERNRRRKGRSNKWVKWQSRKSFEALIGK